MEVIYHKKQLQDYIERQKEMGKKIGFAPTMGALHQGHISLYQKAREENDLVIASIFVNPTQFNNAEDLKKYPRNIEKDISILEKSKWVDMVYIPQVEDIYPENTISKHYDFGGIELAMEGASRPGHFDGVGTVVEELFRQVQPDNAYFGEKDFQQLAIIKKLTQLLNLPIKIHGVPIFREKNGLAMSSRNERLSVESREKASIIHTALVQAKDWFSEFSIEEISEKVAALIASQKNMKLEYFVVADETSLQTTTTKNTSQKYRAFIVVIVDGVRLIDTMEM
ncbi:MAG: pantoate--beta-alanine ligase [Bacteroidetes bacterium]|jgi:pantoate--beta-alanine ligase|nr:pantoate--beta-alanine ligase [Bacteroidota bacterium]